MKATELMLIALFAGVGSATVARPAAAYGPAATQQPAGGSSSDTASDKTADKTAKKKKKKKAAPKSDTSTPAPADKGGM